MGETKQKTGRQGSMGFRITIKLIGAIHRWLYRVSGGKWGQTFFGSPILLLSTTGRRTGQSRTWLATHLPARRRTSHRHRFQRGTAEPPGLVSEPAVKPPGERPTRRPDPPDDRADGGRGREGVAVVTRGRRVSSLRGVSTEDRPADTGRSAALRLEVPRIANTGSSVSENTPRRKPGFREFTF